jgi:hypothetical protein
MLSFVKAVARTSEEKFLAPVTERQALTNAIGGVYLALIRPILSPA